MDVLQNSLGFVWVSAGGLVGRGGTCRSSFRALAATVSLILLLGCSHCRVETGHNDGGIRHTDVSQVDRPKWGVGSADRPPARAWWLLIFVSRIFNQIFSSNTSTHWRGDLFKDITNVETDDLRPSLLLDGVRGMQKQEHLDSMSNYGEILLASHDNLERVTGNNAQDGYRELFRWFSPVEFIMYPALVGISIPFACLSMSSAWMWIT
jgi:hypothetical protein